MNIGRYDCCDVCNVLAEFGVELGCSQCSLRDDTN